MRKFFGLTICVLALSGALASAPAFAEVRHSTETYQINLERQPLGQALNTLSRQTGVLIVSPSELVAGRDAPPLNGTLSVADAVDALLEGSDLTSQQSASGAIIVTQRQGDAVDSASPQNDNGPLLDIVDPDAPLIAETIRIFGQKREKTLGEATSSVAVLGTHNIVDSTFTDLLDVYRFTPNVSVTESSEGSFSIRGISFNGITGAGVANTAAFYVDEVFQSNLGIEAGPLGLFDVAQIEIYRGPQSTLQGRNALAGAIIVRTADPTYDWTAKGRIELAEYNTQRYAVAFGGPLVDDVLAFRVVAEYGKSRGFITNPVLGRNDVDSDETLNLRAKLLFEPTDRLTALVTYYYTEGLAGTGFGTGTVEGPDFFDREVFFDNATLLDIHTHNVSADIEYKFSDVITVQSVTTFTDASEVSRERFPVDPDEATGFDIGTDSEKIVTTDLRLFVETKRWDVLFGFYYFNREQEFERDLLARLAIGPFSTLVNFQAEGGSRIKNFAFYIDGEYAVTDQLSVLFGGRYDNEDFKISNRSSTVFDPEIPPFFVNSIGGVLEADTTFDAFLPKAGFRYEITDDQSIGFVIQRAYRPGGAGTNLANQQFRFGPEYVWSYELAYRSSWWQDRLQININAYYMDWTDQQVNIDGGPNISDSITVNAGKSRLWGIEGELRGQPTDILTLFVSFAYNNTKFTNFDAFDPLLTGNTFPLAPEFQITFGGVVELQSGFYLSLDASYTSSQFGDAQNSPSPALPDVDNRIASYFLVNVKAGYRTDHWSASVFVRNLTNEDYFIRLNRADPRGRGGGLATIGAPRVIGGELTFDF